MKNKFKIVIPMYNVEKWIDRTIESLKSQKYKHFDVVIIDDISTDSSYEKCKSLIEGDDRFSIIKNTEKKYALRNIYEGIEYLNCSDEDIIVTLDGDDWLSSAKVLGHLNKIYNKQDCWLTYGSYAEYPTGRIGTFARQIPQDVIENNSFRENPWCSSHLRSFKYHLWSKIKKEDLLDNRIDV
jgi:glycosyltransferase involved in cell wall biosynthesis